MIGGSPSRMPQSADRRAVYGQRTASRQVDDSWSQAPTNNPKQPAPSSKDEIVYPVGKKTWKKQKKWLVPALIAIVLAAALAILALAWLGSRSSIGSMINEDKYQGVFFTNGQVYFGKLQIINGDYMKLNDVFYIQSDTSAEVAGEEGGELPAMTEQAKDYKLIKRGAEVYGPEDTMIIDRNQVMFIENLKTDSEVSQLIKNYKTKQ